MFDAVKRELGLPCAAFYWTSFLTAAQLAFSASRKTALAAAHGKNKSSPDRAAGQSQNVLLRYTQITSAAWPAPGRSFSRTSFVLIFR